MLIRNQYLQEFSLILHEYVVAINFQTWTLEYISNYKASFGKLFHKAIKKRFCSAEYSYQTTCSYHASVHVPVYVYLICPK